MNMKDFHDSHVNRLQEHNKDVLSTIQNITKDGYKAVDPK